jgi:hypothetical protein
MWGGPDTQIRRWGVGIGIIVIIENKIAALQVQHSEFAVWGHGLDERLEASDANTIPREIQLFQRVPLACLSRKEVRE